MLAPVEDRIVTNSYVIVQRQNYKKLYKVTENGCLTLGKDQFLMSAIIGKPFWTTFKMVPTKKGKRTYALEEATMVESLEDLKERVPCGSDNRCITDDSSSQKLSKEEILSLREAGKSGKEIVGSLIENSKTFAVKTEYSQEKYLKKKERKYFEYLTICKPTVKMLQEICFRQDRSKISGLRMDVLSQLLSYCDVKSEGLYLLYDSGSQGLSAASMLSRIGTSTDGVLIYLHPGNIPQMNLVQAMNFPKEQLNRLSTVNIYSFIRMYYQDNSQSFDECPSSLVSKNDKINSSSPCENEEKSDSLNLSILEECDESDLIENNKDDNFTGKMKTEQNANSMKRKLDEPLDSVPLKKAKWRLVTQNAVDLVKNSKAQGLTIVAREHPLNIVKGLLPFLGSSRPFVIFHNYREPLQETYVALKQRHDIINLRLLSNFLRSYQVLSDRTHPDNLTSDISGYLLTGYIVD